MFCIFNSYHLCLSFDSFPGTMASTKFLYSSFRNSFSFLCKNVSPSLNCPVLYNNSFKTLCSLSGGLKHPIPLLSISATERTQKRYAGHAKWQNIKATKDSKDLERGRIFTKISMQIKMALKGLLGFLNL